MSSGPKQGADPLPLASAQASKHNLKGSDPVFGQQLSSALERLEKLPSLVPGFDLISEGGLPRGRTTLVSGTAGSAKTVFASQFLARGIHEARQPGVFVTFEETAEDIRRNMRGFGWDIAAWEREGLWAFVDASPVASEEIIEIGRYDFSALLARLEHAVRRTGAQRVVLDSVGTVFHQFADSGIVRRELFRVAAALKDLDVTSIITVERPHDAGEIGPYGVEEFVADNVIVLRNSLEGEKRRRTVEILKFRGTTHQKGEFPFTVLPGQGIVVIPLSALELRHQASPERASFGNAELDDMCGGGLFRDSIALVTGATGSGKTLLAAEFLAGGLNRDERSLLLGFDESRDQLLRSTAGWGLDFSGHAERGVLRISCEYPESRGLEDHLVAIKDVIRTFQPGRLVIDSLSALERVGTLKSFREFVIGLTSFVKHEGVTALFTSTAPLFQPGIVGDTQISTITDTIILLRYVELYGEMRRGITVLKMRGSRHDKDIREFTIDCDGMHIGRAFRNVSGILAGHPTQIVSGELDRIESLFPENSID